METNEGCSIYSLKATIMQEIIVITTVTNAAQNARITASQRILLKFL